MHPYLAGFCYPTPLLQNRGWQQFGFGMANPFLIPASLKPTLTPSPPQVLARGPIPTLFMYMKTHPVLPHHPSPSTSHSATDPIMHKHPSKCSC